ncbi:unnamed protein product [Danaus chrysippus]|uniref:(African queen) hypothetical protein n=1 Tax=Danaus chrysippus TaxID=151541 RepID=A0A8J2R7R2_9NEOP|nr:unnamed protein product [Danaus chrysippus]
MAGHMARCFVSGNDAVPPSNDVLPLMTPSTPPPPATRSPPLTPAMIPKQYDESSLCRARLREEAHYR